MHYYTLQSLNYTLTTVYTLMLSCADALYLWRSSSTSIVCRHYLDCLICRYHLTIFTTLAPRGKKEILSPSKENRQQWEEKWENNQQ